MSMEITSTAFQSGAPIPKQYTADGANQSPPLRWSEPPKGTQSFALICDDPDAPSGTWVHWVLFNLPDHRELAAGGWAPLPSGATQGKNSFNKIGYGGPDPPEGKLHHYLFKLYALDVTLNLPSGASKAQLVEAMEGHILARGELMGTYQR